MAREGFSHGALTPSCESTGDRPIIQATQRSSQIPLALHLPGESNAMAARRIVILTEGHTDPLTAKTATSVLRYQPNEVIALLDSTQAGKTSGELLGVGGDTPVIARLDQADNPDTLLIGIAPMGGKLPPA